MANIKNSSKKINFDSTEEINKEKEEEEKEKEQEFNNIFISKPFISVSKDPEFGKES